MFDNTALFTAALQLEYPWKVTKVELKPEKEGSSKMELHIDVDFERGARFIFYFDDGKQWVDADGKPIEKSAHDTVKRTWQHLNFFQYKTYIHARVPKVSDGEGHCPTARVPWARKNSGFTLLFEAMVMEYAKHMSVSSISKLLEVNDKRLWRVIKHYVDDARKLEDYSSVRNLGIDETSRKGHNYISVMVDLDERKVIYTTEGKDHTTVDRFVTDFKEHKGVPDNIDIVTCDMSLGFKKGITENFKNSKTVADKFHVIKHANEAVDKVRKKESKYESELKGSKYLWLKNEGNLTDKQLEWKQKILKSAKHLKTARAYAIRVELQDIYEQCIDRQSAEPRLKKLYSWMMHSRLDDIKEFCKLVKSHWTEILNYFDYRYTNAILEGVNCIIQNVKCRARGFRNMEYFKTMIYLNCGKLDIDTAVNNAIKTFALV